MTDLSQQVALVTGASRGVGRGAALGLASAGATVFATGRSIKQADLGSEITTIACDHTDDGAVAEVFRHIDNEAGCLNILVNVAWGGYERMVEDGRFSGPPRCGSSRRGGGKPCSRRACEPLSSRASMLPAGWSQHTAVLSYTSRLGRPRGTEAMCCTGSRKQRLTRWRRTWRTNFSPMG